MEEKSKPPPQPATKKEIEDAAQALATQMNADVLLYSGGIWDGLDHQLFSMISSRERRPGVLLMMTTWGGIPAVAYRIARYLRAHYEKISLYVHTHCISAGTLIALGADELILSESAQLGPLDMQIRNREEAGERRSGLTAGQALVVLRTEAMATFDEFFEKLRYGRTYGLSTKISAEIAAQMSIGLVRSVYEQIDPMQLGENHRTMTIALEYGDRLKTGNVKDGAIGRLITGYPSHDFVIDRKEAKQLFNHVNPPTPEQAALAQKVVGLVMMGLKKDVHEESALIKMLSLEPEPADHHTKIEEPPVGGATDGKSSATNTGSPKEEPPAHEAPSGVGDNPTPVPAIQAAGGNGETAARSVVRTRSG